MSYYMTNNGLRKSRIQSLFTKIESCTNNGIGCDKNKLIAVYQLEYGFSRRLILEYLALLKTMEMIKEDVTGLWAIKKEQKIEDVNLDEAI